MLISIFVAVVIVIMLGSYAACSMGGESCEIDPQKKDETSSDSEESASNTKTIRLDNVSFKVIDDATVIVTPDDCREDSRNSIHVLSSASKEVLSQEQEDIRTELEWRKDGYKRSFNKNDVVTFYELNKKNNEIYRSYMIVDGFAIRNGNSISAIPLIIYSTKDDTVISGHYAKNYFPELIYKDMYYDSSKYETDEFISKVTALKDFNDKEEVLNILNTYKEKLIGDGVWWTHQSIEEKYLNED